MIQDIEPHRLDNSFDYYAVPDKDSILIHFTRDGLLYGTRLPRLTDLVKIPDKLIYILKLDDTKVFLALDETLEYKDGLCYRKIRELRRSDNITKEELFTAFTAKQLDSWYKNNRYCGHCGNETVRSENERALICTSCGHIIYPRVVPAVIVAVIDRERDKILVTKYNGRGPGYYALVAGFTEIGETLEQTVSREVMEETGLKVRNIRYYRSQPWGVADDILAGFFCELDGDPHIHMDEQELSVAEWKSRAEVELQPDDMSLTNEMMTLFKNSREPQ
ncbi:MAG TPA: NAD(+) diphosphatase [Clostridiales bacterium]|nr:NAD(+) diphosphatase [Clostridiales bacterium]